MAKHKPKSPSNRKSMEQIRVEFLEEALEEYQESPEWQELQDSQIPNEAKIMMPNTVEVVEEFDELFGIHLRIHPESKNLCSATLIFNEFDPATLEEMKQLQIKIEEAGRLQEVLTKSVKELREIFGLKYLDAKKITDPIAAAFSLIEDWDIGIDPMADAEEVDRTLEKMEAAIHSRSVLSEMLKDIPTNKTAADAEEDGEIPVEVLRALSGKDKQLPIFRFLWENYCFDKTKTATLNAIIRSCYAKDNVNDPDADPRTVRKAIGRLEKTLIKASDDKKLVRKYALPEDPRGEFRIIIFN